MNCQNNLTDSYLEQLYTNVTQEHTQLLNTLKNFKPDENIKETDIQKQITITNQILLSIVKLRNIRKKIQSRII